METKTAIALITMLLLTNIGTITYHAVNGDEFNEELFKENGGYFCDDTLLVVPEGDRLSSTEKRWYPTADTTKGYKDCSVGWEWYDAIDRETVQFNCVEMTE